jgi:chromosome segregation ATPase
MDNLEESLELISEQLAALSAQIAEEKKAIGNLWNKVDELQASSANDIEYLSKQISEWTQTNLQLMKLLAAKTEETERLAQNSSLLTDALNELKTQPTRSELQTIESSNFLEELLRGIGRAEKLTQQITNIETTFCELNTGLKGFLKILLSKSLRPDLERLREMARNDEEVNPEKIPQTIDWGMARIYLCQDIANFLEGNLNPHINELKEVIQKKEVDSTSSASPPPVTRQSASFATSEIAAIVVGILSILGLNGWLGIQIGNLQARSEPGYQQAMQYWEWNRDSIQKARSEGKTKTTLWIEEPPPK